MAHANCKSTNVSIRRFVSVCSLLFSCGACAVLACVSFLFVLSCWLSLSLSLLSGVGNLALHPNHDFFGLEASGSGLLHILHWFYHEHRKTQSCRYKERGGSGKKFTLRQYSVRFLCWFCVSLALTFFSLSGALLRLLERVLLGDLRRLDEDSRPEVAVHSQDGDASGARRGRRET